MSHHITLLRGLAQALAAGGLGVYREDGVYQANERGIVVHAFPETPNEVISVALYLPEYTHLSPTAGRRLTRSRVQIRWRISGNPLEGIETFDALSHLLDNQRLVLDGHPFRGRYLSFAPLGQDSNNRFAFTSNWQLTALEAL